MIGRISGWLERVGSVAEFAARVVAALPGSAFRRPIVLVLQFERVALGTLPIVAIAGISVGLVTWLQTRRLLEPYGSESMLPSMLAAAVVIETGPILAGVLLAGRMGAGLGAELGSMVLTEELEARVVLGATEIPTLIAPRVMACTLAAPFLTVILDASAILGGLIAELLGGKLTAQTYCDQSLLFLRMVDVVPATLKTAVFGLVVGLVGCWTGKNAERSTDAVGRAATRGVVRSTVAVFVADVLLVPWIQAAMVVIGLKG
jgi:phospholipid/cholesterol/gamma-HCH transport system permease protein